MRKQFIKYDDRLRFFIGDVRDKVRLHRAFDRVDIVVHAAALKQVPICEYNPIEAIHTNINGAENVINAALDKGVKKVVALSTDKAVNPVNLYGATKLVSDKLFVSGNAYRSPNKETFSVVRYGNVSGSRGSVVPFFKQLLENGEKVLPITDNRMTRFWITLDQCVNIVFKAIDESKGGEIYVAKIPSFKITDLVKAMSPKSTIKDIGIREGEKLHEMMITKEDARTTYEYDDHYIIYPQLDWWNYKENLKEGGRLVEEDFIYSSDTNKHWLNVEQLSKALNNMEIEN
jgi:UDP-N-acetylglucosamine 4,6-dehydratase (inverting)